MNVVVLLKALGALGLLGVTGGGVLATVSRRLSAEPDRNLERVLAELPGANCGACGMPSCFATAAAIAAGRAPSDACVFGGRGVADAVARAVDRRCLDRRFARPRGRR